MNNGKYSQVKIIVQKLHRLPVQQHLHFKNLLTIYRCIYDGAPKYLCDHLLIKTLSRLLTPSSQILLQVPVSRRKCYDDCTFNVAGPTVWNRLPGSVESASSLGIFKCFPNIRMFKTAFSRFIIFSFRIKGFIVQRL